MTDQPRLVLTEIVLDGADAHGLFDFYHARVGGEQGSDEPDWVTLRPPAGPTLAFASEPHYVRPVWPTTPGDPQMMVHLDFQVDDLEAGVAFAVGLGAVEAAYQPQDDVRVLLDPAGHPFCLWVDPVEPRT